MDKYSVITENGYLIFYYNEVLGFPNQTSHWGGYEVIGQIEIKCGNYFVKGKLSFSTGEIFDIHTQLMKLFNSLQGIVRYDSFEGQLSFTLKIDKQGHILIEGNYKEDLIDDTKLIFELRGDQSYLVDCINENKIVIEKYGDNKGIIKNAL